MIYNINTSEIILQTLPRNHDGSVKTNIVSAFVRVFHIVSGSSVNVLASTVLVNDGDYWRYIWTSPSLSAGDYYIEFTITDDDEIVGKSVENLQVVNFVSEETTRILEFTEGNWQIIGDQMLFYSRSAELLARYDLKDSLGNPSMENVFQRVKV